MRLVPILIGALILLSAGLVFAQDAETTAEPEPTLFDTDTRAEIGRYFEFLKQGRVGLVEVRGDGIAEITGQFVTVPVHFWQVERHPGRHYAFVTAPIELSIRTHPLEISITYDDGQREDVTLPVNVSSGGFIQQNVILVEPEQLLLVDPEVEQAEFERIFSVANNVTEERLWDENGFNAPVQAELTSPFGAVRVFNGTLNTLHTGWDFNVQIGRPLKASGAGTVAFAGHMDIRGNYVLIDHGRGVYSGYAHLSVIHVTQGQPVAAGQIIGQVGSTGRSSSAHGHIEFIVNGEWVDAADIISMYLP